MEFYPIYLSFFTVLPFQVANLSANHRANDVIVIEGSEQVIHARFCYGPMDLVALSLETVLGANYKLSIYFLNVWWNYN